jgi:predicted GH43/DUF377 family glycosyl hydrolase
LSFAPGDGVTVLEPETPGRGHWVGAPSVLDEGDRILLAYRLRRPRPDRGYECRVAESTDGVRFTDLWSVRKQALRSASMERFCLRRADDGRYLLYTSYEHPEDCRWRIDVAEAGTVPELDVARAITVLTPAATGTAAVKDPVVVRAGDEWLMFVSTFLTDAGPAPTSLAVSSDGIHFDWRGTVFDVGDGWDRYQARLSAVVEVDDGFAGLYDGAASAAEDTEERLGLAVSRDLRTWERVSVAGPWLVSPHASGSLRYADVLARDNEWWIYYEYARADGSHELRLNRVPKQ